MTSINPSKLKKKAVDDHLLARYETQLEKPAESSGRRRLKKLCEVNESQEMLPSSDQEDLLLQDQQQFQKFGLKDDQDLRKEKEAQEQMKINKKLKGNQQLDKFIEKNVDKKPPSKKEQKQKTQLTLHELNMFKNQKKKQRKYSDDFIVSDQDDIAGQFDEKQIEIKRLAAYQAYNGSKQSQEKLIQRAMKLSLTASSIQKKDPLEEYAFKQSQKPKNTTSILFPEQKPNISQTKKQETPVSEQKKEAKSKSKPKIKQQKVGPLSGLVIVFTGEFQGWDKDQIIEVCEQLGADCPKTFTKKTNLLLQGSYVADAFKRKTTTPINQTKKSKDAIQKGIRIIPFEQLEDFFIEKTGLELDHHLNQNKVGANPVSNLLFRPIDEANGVKNTTDGLKREQKMDIQKPKGSLNSTNSSLSIPDQMDKRLWTQKYKPKVLQEVIGQNSQIKSLREWLQAWEDIHINGNRRQAKETKGWSAAGSINSKAALLSGDPGIGKTTTARLLAAQFNFSVTQFNASDVRNKSGVNLLEAKSHHISMSNTLVKPLIIMDEVDGMSSGDRGGVAAIIAMIKSSKIPIICICNDRSSEKIRSLAGHCLDVKFHKPMKTTMVKRLKEILVQEGGSGEDRALEQLIETFQNDMRQILSYLQIIFKTVTKKITIDSLSRKGNSSKDSSVMINHLDASRKLLNRSDFSRMRIQQRNDCFFVDSDMVPLMVHQNILNSVRKTNSTSATQFRNIVKGLQGFVIGDMLDRSIRKQQEWGLMPSFGFMTCVYAPEKMSESIGFPAFPAWLGKFSSERKMKRLAKEFKDIIMQESKVGGWRSAKSTYLPMITKELAEMLKNDSVQQAVMLMETYNITPAIINEHLASLYFSSDKTNPLTDVPSNIKGKLTRLFNKRHEDAKLKNATKGKIKVEHIKFDPVLEQAQQQIPEQQQQIQKEEEVVKAKGKGKQKQKKKK